MKPMSRMRMLKRLTAAMLALSAGVSVSACTGGLSTPIDQAYYTGGGAFAAKGEYTRTIFSSNDF